MAQRKQKTEKSGCPAENRVELEEKQEAQSAEARKTENGDSANAQEGGRSLLEAILSVDNMFKAQERVISNRGSAGIDAANKVGDDSRRAKLIPHQALSGTK